MALDATTAETTGRPAVTAGAATVALLAALAALGQFANSVYLPSFPAIEAALSTGIAQVQMTLIAFLVPFGVGQLFAGPLSDRYGRRPVLFAGLAVFLAGTALCALAPTIEVLTAGRVAQGFGACTSVIVARAVVRDSFDGDEMARVMGLIAMAFTVSPAVAPFLGGAAQDLFGWRATFALAGLAGATIAAIAFVRLRETNPVFGAPLNLLRRYGPVLRSRVFAGYTMLSGAVIGGLFAFHAGAPHLFIGTLGISATEFGLYPPLTVTGFLVGAWVTRRRLTLWGERRLVPLGVGLLVTGPVLMLAMMAVGWLSVVALMAALWVFVCGMGIVMPLSIAGAIRDFPDRAGTAAAALGFCQMMAGAVGTAVVGVYAPLDHAAFPAGMLTMAGLGVIALTVLRRRAI